MDSLLRTPRSTLNRLLQAAVLLLATQVCADETDVNYGHSLLGEWDYSAVSAGTAATSVSYGSVSFDAVEAIEDSPLVGYKKGAIQKASVSAGWLSSFKSNELSTSFVEVSLSSGIPLGSFDNILGITPSFRTEYINAAPDVDIPSELFETGISFFLKRKFSDNWSAMGIFAPSIRSDFTTSENALRFFGLGLLTWQAVPDRIAWSFGAVFLGRADLPVLPAIGLKYTPSRRTTYDLRFPESRVSWRLTKNGSHSESWLYVSGGFGGNTWAVTRNDGSHDELSLNYLRLLVGAEYLLDGGGRMFIETGGAFNRRLEYESDQSEQTFANAVILQGGINY